MSLDILNQVFGPNRVSTAVESSIIQAEIPRIPPTHHFTGIRLPVYSFTVMCVIVIA